MVKVLSESEMWNVIDESRFAHLACHLDGKTYIVPVSFARDGNRIIGVTSVGMKIEMMRKNPEVCIQFELIESLTRWKSVVLYGRFEELDGSERSRCAGILIDRYGSDFLEEHDSLRSGRDVTPPRLDRKPEPMVVYAIHPGEVTGRSEGF